MRLRPRFRPVALGAVLAIAFALGGCGGDPSSDAPGASSAAVPGTLAGTAWIVVSVNGSAPIAGAVPTISFNADRVNGFFGCNQGGGTYEQDRPNGRILIRELATTLIGCLQPGVGTFEAILVTALGGATRAGLDANGELILSGPGGRIVLVALQHPAAS